MTLIPLFGILLFCTDPSCAGQPNVQTAAVDRPHHSLAIRLLPHSHELVAQDALVIPPHALSALQHPWTFLLNAHLTLDSVRLNDQPVPFHLSISSSPSTGGRPKLQAITLDPGGGIDLDPHQPITLAFTYHGRIDDPPQPSRTLRFIRPDTTSGHIGPEGIYLSTETHWYPNVPDLLSTFTATIILPSGWMAVTQGREIGRSVDDQTATVTWAVEAPTDSLTLAANRFIRKTGRWKGIDLAAYLFPEDAHLAPDYLEATKGYLEFYVGMLGFYPFPKFAVVENFFPSGIGLPSLTLLGSRVIQRGYTQPYSLGHEIVHSWFGNSVLNDVSKGNWVEGLTTYLANYLYEERSTSGDRPQALRKRMVYEYSLYTRPETEYPLVRFHHKERPIDNAIGYQKAAMVFHMLRHEVGEEAFFRGVRQLARDYQNAYADWETLQDVFQRTARRELGWFFRQWVQEPGSPAFALLAPHLHQDPSAEGDVALSLTVNQTSRDYRLRLPIVIHFENGQSSKHEVNLQAKQERVTLTTPALPVRITVDPYFEILRRLRREEIPPMLNHWVTDQNRAVLLPANLSQADQSVFSPILDRVQAQGIEVTRTAFREEEIPKQSLLILSPPKGLQGLTFMNSACRDRVHLDGHRLTIQDQRYEGPDLAFLVTCSHPRFPSHTLTWFSGFSPPAIASIARLLFFYGWDSYLIFRNGKVVARGTFPPVANGTTILLQAP